MNSADFITAFGHIDENIVHEAIEFTQLDDEKNKELVSTINNEKANTCVDGRKKKRLGRTLLIAAVIAGLFTVAAFAIGYTIHQRRQEELRQELKIDEANVQSYVEYETAEAREAGVTLLSSIRNDDHQYVYINVSPIEREAAANFPDSIGFFYTLDGKIWAAANPVFAPDRVATHAEMGAAVLEDAYDEETSTLTLRCDVQCEWLERSLDASGRAELRLVKITEDDDASGYDFLSDWLIDNEESHLCGTVMIAPTELEMRLIRFKDAVFTEPSSGLKIAVEALELSPTGAVWHLRYDGADELYNTHWNESWTQEENDAFSAMQAELCGLEDFVCQSAALHFTDGTELKPGGAFSSSFENGVALPFCAWGTAVDINALESVTVGETQLVISQ